jgi:peroxiredoxin
MNKNRISHITYNKSINPLLMTLNMKKLILLSMAVAVFACQETPKESFVLKGNIEGQESGIVYLQDRVSGLMVKLDSANIENGSFTFEGQMEYPQMYYLSIDGVPGRIGVFMENSVIEIKVEGKEPLVYNVSGSNSHNIFQQLTELIEPHEAKIRILEAEIMNAEVAGDIDETQRLRDQVAQTEGQMKAEIKEFVTSHKDKTVAVFIATRQLMHGTSAAELREIFSVFDPSLKGTRYYDEMETSVLTMERVATGKPAVDFTLNDQNGEEVSLSDLRGKVVLISFWASWCPYCRVSNPDLVKVYSKYGGEKFEVLGVSLDRDHAAWLKGIEEDGLKWIHVSDLKGWQSGPAAEYAVRSIPQNVLIGADGTILDRNVKYHELGARLDGLLKEI